MFIHQEKFFYNMMIYILLLRRRIYIIIGVYNNNKNINNKTAPTLPNEGTERTRVCNNDLITFDTFTRRTIRKIRNTRKSVALIPSLLNKLSAYDPIKTTTFRHKDRANVPKPVSKHGCKGRDIKR